MAQPQPVSADDLPPSMGPPPPPPISLFDPDRSYAKDQPPNMREAFTSFYPNGLPTMYKMLQIPGLEGVAQTYIEDYLPVGFFKSPPVEAGAVFSTENGKRQFRQPIDPLPQRRIHLWTKDEIQSVCNSLRRLYWHIIKDMQKPYCWDSLRSYFDALDIYNYGALNLWNVVSHLFDENQVIYEDVKRLYAVEIGHWANNWVQDDGNRKKLNQWKQADGPLMSLLTEADWAGVGSVPDNAYTLITSALEHRRSLMLAPDKLRPDTKPNHLKESCENNSLENWLAGQRIFDPVGLPKRPQWHPHHGSPTSQNTPAPIVMVRGEHYYDPSGRRMPSAVEALHQSAAAAGRACHSTGERVSTGQPRTRDEASCETLHVSPQARSKSTEPFSSFRTPSPHASDEHNDEEVTFSDVRRSSMERFHENDDHKDFDALTPTKQPAQVTWSRSKESQAPQNDKIGGVESRLSANEKHQKSQQPIRSLARSGAHDQNDTQFPGPMHAFNRQKRLDAQNNAMASGLPEEMMIAQPNGMHPPLGTAFQPSGVFNNAAQVSYSVPQQNFAMQSGPDYLHPHVQQPSVPQKGPIPSRGRNTSASSRFEPNDGRWSHQNYENSNSGNPGFNRGGCQRGGGRKGRRGAYSQRNATAPVIQQHAGSEIGQKRRDATPWRDSWRRGGSDLIQVTCQNLQDGLKIKGYVHCSCQVCESRNRSVHVAVEACQETSSQDLLARIKPGLAMLYGHVEDVCTLPPKKEQGRFIVRFADPSSVGRALEVGGDHMREQGISVTFSPVWGSKWTVSKQTPTRPVPGQVNGQQSSTASFSPYPFGLSIPGNASSAAVAPPTMLPRMYHPVVINPVQSHNAPFWPSSGGQRAVSGLVQPPVSGGPSAMVQPTASLQQYFSRPPTLTRRQFTVPPAAQLETDYVSSHEPLQTKPPAEEALNETHGIEQDGTGSPRSDGSKCAGVKARVSLPNTPTKASPSFQEPQAKTKPQNETLGGVDTTTNNDEAPIKALEGQDKEEATVAPISESISGKDSRNRVSSSFTENEIKERRQAWAKISMPLNPHRPRPSTPVKPNRDTIKDDHDFQVANGDKYATKVTGSEKSSPSPNMVLTPDTGSVYESSEKPEDKTSLRHEPMDPSATHPDKSTREDAIDLEKTDQNQTLPFALSTASPVIGNSTREEKRSKQMNVYKSHGRDISSHGSHPSQQQEDGLNTQSKAKGKNPKKAKKKKSKQKMVPQSNVSDLHADQQNQFSTTTQFQNVIPQTMHTSGREIGFGPASVTHLEGQKSSSSSPTKRHHDEPERRSGSASFKRSKKDENNQGAAQDQSQSQQLTLDESDSPDEDNRGRRGFRMGKGGSLRLGKQRRPPAITTGSILAGQGLGAQIPPPSSDFAFQIQGLPFPNKLPNLHGPENGAMSRLNPKAQEFVSPSRLDSLSKPLVARSETTGSCTLNGSAIHAHKIDEEFREPTKTENDNLEAPLQKEKTHSAATSETPKHRRAVSEIIQKETAGGDKGAAHGEGKKTPAKGSKRGKGKERAITLSAKADKVQGKKEKVQGTPETPEHRGAKVQKPGLINDGWPSLPASRDRAQSKPQIPPVWGGKTKPTGSDSAGQGSPLARD
ncbi:hypothetical protein F53441_12060 [Fusarium austroafricanum]|uniref:RRM domain-containing protein n=1 Tax=Fusarium austroafricanum TaxID=2364996 RepID=A0A8H4K001_9HYPO|nr:hypothetical protein F53441_12060 [Fusarium austroafricanum]